RDAGTVREAPAAARRPDSREQRDLPRHRTRRRAHPALPRLCRRAAPSGRCRNGPGGSARRGIAPHAQGIVMSATHSDSDRGLVPADGASRALALTVVDAGVDAHIAPDPRLIDAKVRRGTRDFGFESAMTPAECREALARAELIVDGIAARGSNTLVLGEMGIGNTASASVLM